MAEYVPSQQEIARRCELLKYMQMMGWDQETQDHIMYRDNPEPEKVRKLIYMHGPDKALTLIKREFHE